MKHFPAIALIEFRSIAAGAFAADKMVKRAPIDLLQAGTVQPGKYLILVGGGTAEVEESYREAMQVADDEILDEVLLLDVHPQVLTAMNTSPSFDNYESLVVLETSTTAAVIRATDAAAKSALAEVAEIRLANGLGGRGVAILGGTLTDVEAAFESAQQALAGREGTLCHSIISNIHPQFADRLGHSTRFFQTSANNLGD